VQQRWLVVNLGFLIYALCRRDGRRCYCVAGCWFVALPGFQALQRNEPKWTAGVLAGCLGRRLAARPLV